MDKKAVKALPVKKAEPSLFRLVKAFPQKGRIKVILDSELSGNLLVVYAYLTDSLRLNDPLPDFVTFIEREKDEFLARALDRKTRSYEWSSSSLKTRYAVQFPYADGAMFASATSEKRVLKYFGLKEGSGGQAIESFQSGIRERARLKALEKELLPIDRAMSVIGSDPPGLYDYAYKEILKPALLYENSKNGKEMRCVCTECMTERILPKDKNLKHRKDYVCPFCGIKVKGLSVGKIPSGWTQETVKLCALERITEDLFVFRYFTAHEKYYVKRGIREKEPLYEVGRDFYGIDRSGNGHDTYTRYEKMNRKGIFRWWPSPDNGTRIKWSSMQTVSGLERYANDSIIYPASVERALTGEEWKYFPLKEQITALPDRFYEFSLEAYRLHPVSTEKLIKTGLYHIAAEVLYEYKKEVNENKTDILEILGLKTRSELKLLKEFDSLKVLSYIQESHGLPGQKELTAEDIRGRMLAENFSRTSLQKIHNAGVPTRKFLKYMYKELGLGEVHFTLTKQQITKCQNFITDYADYLDNLDTLMVEKGKGNLYPKDLKRVHDITLEQVREYREAQKKKAESDIEKGIRKAFSEISAILLGAGFSESADHSFTKKGSGLCVVVPSSKQDLVHEGSSLGHCVGVNGYDRMIAQHKCQIFFIRDAESPGKPYFTMEYRYGEHIINQCRTYHNESYDNGKHADIVEFSEQLKKAMIHSEKKELQEIAA